MVAYGSSVVYAADTLLALDDRGAGVPLRELALVGLTAAIITYFATGWVRVLARRLGAVAVPRDRDVHLEPIPRMGGLAMYIGVVVAVLLASQLPALTRGFVYSTGMPAVVVAGLCACGTSNDSDAIFCKRCGARLTGPMKPERPTAMPHDEHDDSMNTKKTSRNPS